MRVYYYHLHDPRIFLKNLEGLVAEMSYFILGPNMAFFKLWGLGWKNIVGGPLG